MAALALVALGAGAFLPGNEPCADPPQTVWMRAAPPDDAGAVVSGDEVRAGFDGAALALVVLANEGRRVQVTPRRPLVRRVLDRLGVADPAPEHWAGDYEAEPVVAQAGTPWRQLRLVSVTRRSVPFAPPWSDPVVRTR